MKLREQELFEKSAETEWFGKTRTVASRTDQEAGAQFEAAKIDP